MLICLLIVVHLYKAESYSIFVFLKCPLLYPSHIENLCCFFNAHRNRCCCCIAVLPCIRNIKIFCFFYFFFCHFYYNIKLLLLLLLLLWLIHIYIINKKQIHVLINQPYTIIAQRNLFIFISGAGLIPFCWVVSCPNLVAFCGGGGVFLWSRLMIGIKIKKWIA